MRHHFFARLLTCVFACALYIGLTGSTSGGPGRAVSHPPTPPNAPTLVSPPDGAVITTPPIRLQMSALAPLSSGVSFAVGLFRGGGLIEWYDQLQSPEGWDAPSYPSGDTATFTIPIALDPGDYEWKAFAYAWYGATPVPGPMSEVRTFHYRPTAPAMPTLYGVYPNPVYRGASAELQVKGTQLPQGLAGAPMQLDQIVARLEGAGLAPITGMVLAFEGKATFRLRFDLTNAAAAIYDLVLQFPGGSVARLRNGVTVVEPGDLALEELVLNPAQPDGEGQQVAVSARVRNVGGSVMRPPIVVKVEAWGQVLEVPWGSALAAGQDVTVTALPIVKAGPAGVVRAVAAAPAAAEADVTNNTKEQPVPAVALPDLELLGLQIQPASPRSG
ncbi:MAG: hypothetical protein QHJ73_15685, partial [Armatimonadota bacterium]|nr:hypothetical protein [Armatimonadota bacterium]